MPAEYTAERQRMQGEEDHVEQFLSKQTDTARSITFEDFPRPKTTKPPSLLLLLPLKSDCGRALHGLLSRTQSARTQRSVSAGRRSTHLNTGGRNSVGLRNALNRRAA